MRDLVLRLGASRPAVVVLEDIHWADAATLSMLEHLVDPLEDARILVLATYRGNELGLGTPLARTVERLIRHRSCSTLSLRPLDLGETAELITAVSGRVPPPALSARLWADGDGNPFFVQELFKHLGAEHPLYDEDGLFRTDVATQALAVPESLRLLLGHRLQRLSDRCRRILNVAAVMARDVDVDLLTQVAEGDGEDVVEAVEEALAAGVLVPRADLVGFSHALLREAALAELSPIRKRRLHAAVAGTLRRVHGEDPVHAAEIADHLDQAGAAVDAETKVRYLELAARRSLESAAYEDASERFQRALALVPADQRTARARLLAGMGYAQRGMGAPEDANASWREAVDLLEQDPDRDVTLIAELCRVLGRYLDATGGLEEAVAVIERGLRLVGPDRAAERSWLRSALGYTLTLQGDLAAGAAAIEEAAELAGTLGDTRLRADVLASKTTLHFASGRLVECIDTAAAASKALASCGHLWDAIQADVTTLWPRIWVGRIDDARRHTDVSLPAAERVGHVPAIFLGRRTRALLDFLADGDVARFADQAGEAVGFCRANRLRWLADSYVFAGLAEFWMGDWDAARRHFEEATAAPAPPIYAGRYSASFLAYLGWAGDAAAFDRLLARLRGAFAAMGVERSIGTVAVTLAEVEGQALLGRSAEAAALYPSLAALLDEGVVLRPPDLRIVHALAGLAAGLAGEHARADFHFDEARRLIEALPHPRQAPEVDFLQALALVGGPRRTPAPGKVARRLLEEAMAGYNKLGMPGHRRRAESLLGQVQR